MNNKKNYLMYGAVIGDIVGSMWEFSMSVEDKPLSYDFELFPKDANYTDDTVMSVAIAYSLLHQLDVSKTMREFAVKYPCPKGGYGGRFSRWLFDDSMGPINSFGNGAGMRVSSVGYFASSVEECKLLSKKVTEVTHNHPEGLKGAETISLMVYYALHNKELTFLKDYAISSYPQINSFDYEGLRKNYVHNSTCQGSIPEALYCFLTSKSFEDCLRRINYIGGDTDTTGAMACAIASAYYKWIPSFMIEETKKRLPQIFIDTIEAVPLSY